MSWSPGDVIVRREVLNDGRPWLGLAVRVVEDTPEHLVTYAAEGAALGFPEGVFPTPDGHHPWRGRTAWQGHGTLMVQRPDEDVAVWHFWHGPDRRFLSWYVNLQEAFRRTPVGMDTQDLELDIVVLADGSWEFKDRELMADRIVEGRYTAGQVERTLALGDRLGAALDAGRALWDASWVDWAPDPSWGGEALPEGWAEIPSPRRRVGPDRP